MRCNWFTAVLCRFTARGLEIPCCYIFKAIEVFEMEKARKMIEVILSVVIAPVVEFDSETNKLKKPHQMIMKQLVKLMRTCQKAMNQPIRGESSVLQRLKR